MSGRPAARGLGRGARIAICLTLVAALAAGGWWYWFNRPARVLERAISIARHDPATAERLARQAMGPEGAGRFGDAQVLVCTLLGRREAWEEATGLFVMLERGSCRGDLLLTLGREAQEAGCKAISRPALEELADRDRREAGPALELLAADFYDCEQLFAAIEAARHLTRIDPDNPRGWVFLGKLLKETFREDEFVATMRQALERDLPEKELREIQHRLIDALIVNGDSADAWPIVQQLKTAEGDSPRVRGYEIDLNRMDGDPQRALELFLEIFPDVKDEPTAFFTRGSLYLDLRRYEEAVHDFRIAVARQPGNEWAHANLADALRRLGKTEEARQEQEISDRMNVTRARYSKLLRRRPGEMENRELLEELSKLAIELNEPEAARHYDQRIRRLTEGLRGACPEPRHVPQVPTISN